MSRHEADFLNAAGFVLAGGRSSRMGSDKALSLIHGLPLIQVAVQALRGVGIPVRIAGARSDLSRFAEIIPDIQPGVGPLAGVQAALSASFAEWNLFLPVDLPLLPAGLLECLLRRAILTAAPVTAVKLNGRLQPFPVVLRRSVLAAIEDRLATGRLACYAAWEAIPLELGALLDAPAVESLLQCGQILAPGGRPPAFWFQSANTPEDLSRIHSLDAAQT